MHKSLTALFVATMLSGVVLSCSQEVQMETEEDQTYIQAIEDWRASRIERLRKPTSWLSLVGLYPLKEGDNTLGAADDNDLLFPATAPAHGGVITLKDGVATLKVEPSVSVMHDSTAVETIVLIPDDQENPVVVEMGERFNFYHIERAGQHYIRLRDTQSELFARFNDTIPAWPVSVAWRIEAQWEDYPEPKKITIPNILGYEEEMEITGAAVFEWNGEKHVLEPSNNDSTTVFFVFADATTGTETYGGGRYMYMDPPDSTGRIVLDFNKCYNPPCVFTPFATCPLPREGNILPFRVEAGEKMLQVPLY